MAGRVGAYLRSNVLGLVAIFIALSAGAYALGLPKNSVRSKQIKDGAVKSKDVANGSLLGEDFAAGQLPAGATGPQGPPGPSSGPAGGDLTGNYPDPVVGPDAISGAEVADGSLGAADIAVATGTFNSDVPSIAAGSCTFDVSSGYIQDVVPGDAVVMSPSTVASGLPNFWAGGTKIVYNALVEAPGGPAPPARLNLHICNLSSSAIDPPATVWRYVVLR